MSNVKIIPAHVDTPPVDADSVEFARFVPERFVEFALGETDLEAAWGDWLELTHDPDF